MLVVLIVLLGMPAVWECQYGNYAGPTFLPIPSTTPTNPSLEEVDPLHIQIMLGIMLVVMTIYK